MLDVIILTIAPSLTQCEFEALCPLVSGEKQERIRRFHFFRDAQNALLGDIAARAEICRVTGLNNQQLVFAVNQYGKPFLPGLPQLHYNISHTGHYIACATADAPVGIDIELIQPTDLKIAERFFAPDETAYIMEDQQTQRFFEVWTRKESRIKWEGKGLSKPLPSFSVFDPIELEKLSYYKVFQNEEVICHVCASKGEKPVVRMMGTAEFLRAAQQYIKP